MKPRTLRTICLIAGLLSAPATVIFAQAPPPGGPGGPPGPASHAGLGGPGGMSRPDNSDHAQQDVKSAASARNALQFGPVGRWWDDRSVAQQVGLSHEQQKRMDSIFNAGKPAIVQTYKAFLKAQSNLEKVNKDTTADKATVFASVDAVNQARSALQKATLSMLMQIREQMNASQIEKLQKLQ